MFLFLGFLLAVGANTTLLSEHQTKTRTDANGTQPDPNVPKVNIMSHMPSYMKDVLDSLFEQGHSHSKRSLTGADIVGNFASPLSTTVSMIRANPTLSTLGLDTYYYLQLLWVGYPYPSGLGARCEYGFKYNSSGLFQYMYMESYQGYVIVTNLKPGVTLEFVTTYSFMISKSVTTSSPMNVIPYYDYISGPYVGITYTAYYSELSDIYFQYAKTFGGIQLGHSNRGSATCSTFDASASVWDQTFVCDYPIFGNPLIGHLCGATAHYSTHYPTCGTGSVTQGTTSTSIYLNP